MKKLNEEKGITLIALVITIIVLLILAGISISALSGNNGILTKAKEASEKTIVAQDKEERTLLQIEAAANYESFEYTDKNNKTVPIPAECTVSKKEGESTVEDGLVIIDKNGNEWVWILCNTTTEYKVADDGWAQGGYIDDSKTWTDSQSTGVGTTSVTKNGGFYISRYEAGIPENMTSAYVNTDGAKYVKDEEKNKTENINQYTAVSKPNVQAWNYIIQPNAKIVAEKMLNNSSAQSYLIDSYAWNALCRKISVTKNITDSTKWGNYYNNTTTEYEKINTLFAVHKYISEWQPATVYNKGLVTGAPKGSENNRLELATGASEDFKVYNVYDIAGNMWEWTTEESSNNSVLRGGSFNNDGVDLPVVYRNGSNSTSSYGINVGFRAVLYVK